MKKLKKVTIIIMLVFILIPIAAEDFVATGYGESQQAAREDALATLVSQISTNVSSLVVTQSVDDGHTSSERYESRVLQNSDFTPVGTQFSAATIDNGFWKVNVTLPSSSAHLYYDRLAEKADEISNMYNSIGKLQDLSSVSYAELDQLSSLLSSFEVDRIVATSLDRNAGKIPELPVSRSQVKARRNVKLQREEDSLEIELDTYDMAKAFGLLTEEMEADRDALEKRLKELQEDSNARIERLDAETEQLLESLRPEALAVVDSNDVSDSSDMSVINRIDEIALRLSSLDAIRSSVSEAIVQLDAEYNEQVDSFIEENMTREYPAIMLGSDGKPTAEAVQTRRVGFENAAKKQFAPSYAESMKSQMGRALSLICNNIEDIAEIAQEAAGKRLRFSSSGEMLSVAVDGTDGNNFSGVMHLSLAGKEISLDLRVPFSAWMDEPVPNARTEIFEYEEYLFIVSQWLSMLMDNTGLMRVELEFSIDYDPIKYGLYFVPSAYTVTRLDTGKAVYAESLSNDIKPIRLCVLPFDFDDAFSFSFQSNIGTDYSTYGFTPYLMIKDAIAKADLESKVDIFNLSLAKLSDNVMDELESKSLNERFSITSGNIDTLVKEDENTKEAEAKTQKNVETLNSVLNESMFVLEPYISGGGAFFKHSDNGESIRRGEFSIGLAVFYNLTNAGIDMYAGFGADLLYACTTSSTDVDGGIVENRTHAIGGAFNVICGGVMRLPSLAIKGQVWVGAGWYPEAEILIGGAAGALIPAGDGLLDLSAKLQLSMPCSALDDSSYSNDSSVGFCFGISVGYAFRLG